MTPSSTYSSAAPPRKGLWDTLGISASALCAVHCLLLPVALVAFPMFAEKVGRSGDHLFHEGMAVLVAATGLAAFLLGFLRHRRPSVLLLAAFGLGAILLGSFGHEVLPSHGWARGVTLAGSAILITAHTINRRFCGVCADHSH